MIGAKKFFNAPNGAVVFSLNKKYEYVFFNENHATTIKAIWGVEISLGQCMLDIILDENDKAKAKQNFDRALTGESFILEEAYGSSELDRRFYQDSYFPFYEEGHISGLTVWVTDITERKLKDIRNNSFIELFKISSDFLSISSTNGYLLEINPIWSELLGYSEKELKSSPYLSFVHPEDHEKNKVLGEKMRTEGVKAINFESRLKTKDDRIVWLEWNAVLEKDKELYFSVGRDITEIKRRQNFEKSNLNTQIELSLLSQLSEHRLTDFIEIFVRKVREVFNLDWCAYWEFDSQGQFISCRHLSSSTPSDKPPDQIITKRDFPRYFHAVESETIVAANDAVNDPRTNEFAIGYLDVYDIKSMLDIQVHGGKDLLGVICFESKEQRIWSIEEQNSAAAFSYILKNAFNNDRLREEKEALGTSNDLLTKTTEAATIGTWDLNTDTGILKIGEVTRQIHGLLEKKEATLEEALSFYKEGENRDRIYNAFNKSFFEGKPFDVESLLITLNGDERWVRTIGTPIMKDGECVRCYGTIQDIDSGKKNEIELAKLSLVASHIQNSVVITNAQRAITWVNTAFEINSGYSLNEVIGKLPESLIQGPLTDPDHINKIQKGLESKKPFTQEVLNYRKNGSTHWNEISVTPMLDDHGEVTQYIAIQSEIDDRKENQAALAESEERYRNLTESAPVGILVSTNGLLKYINPFGRILVEADPDDDMLDRPILESLHPDSLEFGTKRVMELMQGKIAVVPPAEEKIITVKGNIKHVMISGIRIMYQNQPAVCSVLSDITELKEYQFQLHKTLEAKNTLFQELHHRIKNNLQLVSSLMTIQSQTIDNEQVSSFVRDTGTRIRSISEIHDQLLKMEEIDTLSIKHYLENLIRSLINTYTLTPELFDLHLEIEDHKVHIDKVMILGLLCNEIISNILKHAYDNGGPVHVQLVSKGEDLTLKVWDEGQGINEDEMQKSSGMELIELFAQQLYGKLNSSYNNGVSHELTFRL